MEPTLKRKLTLAKSWRAEMQENIQQAYFELFWWLDKPMGTRTNRELETAAQKIADSIRIMKWAERLEGGVNFLEETITEDVE